MPFEALSLSRRRLDAALLDAAERAGATVRRGTIVRRIENGRVETSAGSLAAAERHEGQRPLARAIAPIEELHAQLGAGITAGVAILDPARHLIGGQRRLRRGDDEGEAEREGQAHAVPLRLCETFHKRSN